MAGLGIVKKNNMVDVDDLKRMFPKKKGTITEKTAEMINEVQNEAEFDGAKFVDTLYSYQNVMYKNSANIDQYIDAIRFAAYLESGDSSIDAYKKTFSRREFVQNRMNVSTDSSEYRELASAATRFKKSPMVVDIMAQADVPLYLMFQGTRYEAVNVLAKEMVDARHAKDRISAAKAILEQVKPPENLKIEMDIGVKENNAIQDLNDQLAKLASSQLVHLESGSTDLDQLGAMKPNSDVIEAEIDE